MPLFNGFKTKQIGLRVQSESVQSTRLPSPRIGFHWNPLKPRVRSELKTFFHRSAPLVLAISTGQLTAVCHLSVQSHPNIIPDHPNRFELESRTNHPNAKMGDLNYSDPQIDRTDHYVKYPEGFSTRDNRPLKARFLQRYRQENQDQLILPVHPPAGGQFHMLQDQVAGDQPAGQLNQPQFQVLNPPPAPWLIPAPYQEPAVQPLSDSQANQNLMLLVETALGLQRSNQPSVQDAEPVDQSLNRPQVLDSPPLDQPLDLSLKPRQTQKSALDSVSTKAKAAREHHQPDPWLSSSRVAPPVTQQSKEQPLHGDFIGRLLAQLTYRQLLDLNRVGQRSLNLKEFRWILNILVLARRKQLDLLKKTNTFLAAEPQTEPLKSIEPVHMKAWFKEVVKVLKQIRPAPAPFFSQLIRQLAKPTKQHKATSQLVAIDPSKDHCGPEYQLESVPTDQLEGASSRDLVLVQDGAGSFNNRWTPTDLVDDRAVRFWRAGPVLLNISRLRRVKIYGFHSGPLHNVLQFLSNTKGINLLELQIGGLKPPQCPNAIYRFDSLQTLSIDSFEIVDEKKEQAASGVYTFEVPKLNNVFVGELLDQLDSKCWTVSNEYIYFPISLSGHNLV